MSRLLILSILVLWMCPRGNVSAPAHTTAALTAFFGVYGFMVVIVALWSRLAARRIIDGDTGRTLRRYYRVSDIARYFVPIWFAVGIFALGWGHFIAQVLAPLDPAGHSVSFSAQNYWRISGLIIGTAPALLTWMGLWWAQFPADRAMREQNIKYAIDEGLPVRMPPGFLAFFIENLRLQFLLILVPIFLIAAGRDLMALAMFLFDRPLAADAADGFLLPMALLVFVLAPEILRRVIKTRPLERTDPLRRRLETLCKRTNLTCRDILVWETRHLLGNAMVMGIFPRIRYIFLSDLLIETMRDDEIEAVFAHEIGHIRHRHFWWYGVFIIILMLFMVGPISLVLGKIPWLAIPNNASLAMEQSRQILQAQVIAAMELPLFWLIFGFISRRFERQADVFAARTMQSMSAATPMVISHVNLEAESGSLFVPGLATVTVGGGEVMTQATIPPRSESYVGEYGAAVVASALHRVAKINNIPISAREWLHGSISSRMRYLRELSGEPGRTALFDRYMKRMYVGLIAVMLGLGAWFCVQYQVW